MKKIFLPLLVCIFSFVIQQSFAQKEIPPKGGTPKNFKLPQKDIVTLPNGFKAFLVPYGNVPKVTISLNIKTGNVHESADEIWLSDLTGQMINQGSLKMDFKTLSQKVAGMGGDINVRVSPDQTVISGSVLSEFAADFIDVISDLVQNPAFPPNDFDRIRNDFKRKVVLEKSVPQNLAQSIFSKAIFKDSPYGRYFPTEEMLDGYTLQMVKDFYNENYGAKRTVLFVSGVFDKNKVNNGIKNSFGNWKPGPDIDYPKPDLTAQADTIIENRKGAPQTTLILGLPTVSPGDKDYLPFNISNSLLGGSFGSRITSNIRENKGYTYSPYSTIDYTKGGTVWMEVADVTSANTIDALREINNEISKLKQTPPSPAELDGIKNYEAGIFVLQNSMPGGIISQLNFLDMYGIPDSYLKNMVENIYKITPQQVSDLVKKYIDQSKMTLVMVGDKESIEQQMK